MAANTGMDPAERLVTQLRGTVLPAVITPMDADGTIDQAALERYAEMLTGGPIGGVAVWAHTGRALYLPEPDRARILRTLRAATTLPVVAGAGVPVHSPADTAPHAISATVAMARAAADLGADAIMVYPPVAFAQREDRNSLLLDLHDVVADATGLPLIGFHLHEAAGGYQYDRAFLAELLARPSVAGVKTATLDQAIDCQETLDACVAAGKLAVTGEDRMFGPSLMWGADCALVGIAAAALPVTCNVVETWRAGDADGFVAASRRFDRFAAVTFDRPIEGYVQRMMWVAAAEGLIPDDAAHDPFGPPYRVDDRERVVAAFDMTRARRFA
jgi:4-hydroxy-tetrahydrodipicolinate synthase